MPTPFTLLPTFDPITAVNDGAPPDVVTPQPKVEATNMTVGEYDSAPTSQRLLQVLRDSVKFDPANRPSPTRTDGDGPLKRIVNALNALRPKPAAEDAPKDEVETHETKTPAA